jgi:hypothetical protein
VPLPRSRREPVLLEDTTTPLPICLPSRQFTALPPIAVINCDQLLFDGSIRNRMSRNDILSRTVLDMKPRVTNQRTPVRCGAVRYGRISTADAA